MNFPELIQPERDFNVELDRNWMSVFRPWREAPFANRLHCFFVESHAERARDADVFRRTVRADHNPQDNDALVLGLASFVGIFRIRVVNRTRPDDATPKSVGPVSGPPSRAHANSRAASIAYSSLGAAAIPAFAPDAIRSWRRDGSHRIAQRQRLRRGRRSHNCGRDRNFGFLVGHHDGWRSYLPARGQRKRAVRRFQFVMGAAATTTVAIE